jgi:signal recognition particle GTPase
MLVAADVYRPAAIDQLTILGKKVKSVELAIDACSVSFTIHLLECSSVTYSSVENI